MQKYIDNPYVNWYGINETGRDYYEYQIGKMKRAEEKNELQSLSQITFNHNTGNNNQVNSPAASMEVSNLAAGGASEELAKKNWRIGRRGGGTGPGR